MTLVYPYYENPETLRAQIKHWCAYPADLKRYLRVIIVDDGSPDHPAVVVIRQEAPELNLRLLRVDVDIRWNQHAARNIGMEQAGPGWCLLTDMDHIVPVDTARTAIQGQLDPEAVYRFSRRDPAGTVLQPHPNSWLMTRAMFWRTGGYDEALSGLYGTDRDYRIRVAGTAPVHILTDFLIRNEYDGDSSTTRYLRNQPQDRAFQDIVAARGLGWRPKTLSFPYHEIELRAGQPTKAEP
jgi:hypothetical protein